MWAGNVKGHVGTANHDHVDIERDVSTTRMGLDTV